MFDRDPSPPTSLATYLDDVSGARAPSDLVSSVRTVLMASPVARATMATPPQPIASASVPAQSRRTRSSMASRSSRHFFRTRRSTSTPDVDHSIEIASVFSGLE
jgi:hypothetical protein